MRKDRVIRAEKRMDTAVIVVDVWKLQYYCKNGCKEQMTCVHRFFCPFLARAAATTWKTRKSKHLRYFILE
jgi:hypothetical protein